MNKDILKKTKLYDLHCQLGAKLVPFAGWEMPISYAKTPASGPLAEHLHVRQYCGLFDVSHMGEFLIFGKDSGIFLNALLMNDLSKLVIGCSQYTAALNSHGGFIDDLIVYRLGDDRYMLCVNASNTEIIANHLREQKSSAPFKSMDVEINDISESVCQIAVQGPLSKSSLFKVLPNLEKQIDNLKFGAFFEQNEGGGKFLCARTGYTGELGYELYTDAAQGQRLWQALCEIDNVQPIGLGARDSLRLEAGFPLYGNELNNKRNPLAVGLGWACPLNQGEFLGKEAVATYKKHQISQNLMTNRLLAFEMLERAVPRGEMDVYHDSGKAGLLKVGVVTSGGKLPSVDKFGGMVFLDSSPFSKLKVGDSVAIDVRGKLHQARICAKPFYKSKASDII